MDNSEPPNSAEVKHLKVTALLEILQKMPPDSIVVVAGALDPGCYGSFNIGFLTIANIQECYAEVGDPYNGIPCYSELKDWEVQLDSNKEKDIRTVVRLNLAWRP